MNHPTRFPACYDEWSEDLPFEHLLSEMADPVGRLIHRLRTSASTFGTAALSEPERLYLSFDAFSAALADGSCLMFIETASAETLADISTCFSMYDHREPGEAFNALCEGVAAGVFSRARPHAVYDCVDPITFVQFELNAMMDNYAEQHALFDAVVYRMPREPAALM